MAKAKFHSPAKDEEVFPNLRQPLHLGCCDCGLVHNVPFTLYYKGKKVHKPGKKGYRISLSFSRNEEETNQLRTERKFKYHG